MSVVSVVVAAADSRMSYVVCRASSPLSPPFNCADHAGDSFVSSLALCFLSAARVLTAQTYCSPRSVHASALSLSVRFPALLSLSHARVSRRPLSSPSPPSALCLPFDCVSAHLWSVTFVPLPMARGSSPSLPVKGLRCPIAYDVVCCAHSCDVVCPSVRLCMYCCVCPLSRSSLPRYPVSLAAIPFVV
jgi:hypothetical protein